MKLISLTMTLKPNWKRKKMQTFLVNCIWILLKHFLAQNYLFDPFDLVLVVFMTDALKYHSIMVAYQQMPRHRYRGYLH